MSFGLGKLGRLGRLGVASGRGTGGGGISVQKDMYFSGKNAYIYACSKNGIKELHLYGHSEQDGVPAPDTPAEISSVGDSYLQLYVLDINHPDKRGQIIDFGDIVLRSLPSGACDEIVYRDKQWRYIQRIAHFTADGNSNVSPSLFRENVTSCTYYPNTSLGPNFKENSPILCNRKVGKYNYYEPDCIFNTTVTTNYVIITYLNDTGAQYTKEQIAEINAQYPLDFIVELATPIETVLDLPQIEF